MFLFDINGRVIKNLNKYSMGDNSGQLQSHSFQKNNLNGLILITLYIKYKLTMSIKPSINDSKKIKLRFNLISQYNDDTT